MLLILKTIRVNSFFARIMLVRTYWYNCVDCLHTQPSYFFTLTTNTAEIKTGRKVLNDRRYLA